MDTVLFWLGIGIIFLIIEIITTTFYGFSLAIAAFLIAIYTHFYPSGLSLLLQWVIFTIISIILSYFLPKIFMKKIEETSENKAQWLDKYIGEVHKVYQNGEDFRIQLDGIWYTVISDDNLSEWDKIQIINRRGSIFIWEK